MLEKVFELIEADREAMIQATSRLLQFESVREEQAGDDPLGPGLRQALGFVGELARKFGLGFREVGGVVGVAELGEGEESVGALLHLDVVPAGEGWDKPPFSGAVEGGEIWGRGAWDDKGPCVSVLFAAKAIAAANVPLRRKIKIIFGTDEESGVWSDIERYLELEHPPTMSFVPDGSFGVTNAEKGMVNIALTVGRGGLWGKPRARLVSLSAGERPNMVPDRAEALLQPLHEAEEYARYLAARVEAFAQSRPGAKIELKQTAEGLHLCAEGKSAHGSTPHLGRSALLDLVDFLAAERLDDLPPANMARLLGELIGRDLNGERLGIFHSHEFMGHTTVNIGTAQCTAQGARAVANVRIPLGLTPEEVERRVRRALGAWQMRWHVEARAEIEGKSYEPLYVEPESELVRGLRAAFERVMGQPCELLAMGGTTFAKSMPNAVAFGPKMPEEPDLAHGPNERIAADVLVRNAKIYAAAFLELVG